MLWGAKRQVNDQSSPGISKGVGKNGGACSYFRTSVPASSAGSSSLNSLRFLYAIHVITKQISIGGTTSSKIPLFNAWITREPEPAAWV
jgi:hypothetical protein